MPDNGNDSPSRLDRIEGIIEAIATRQADPEDEFRRLLSAQVVMVDTVQDLAEAQRRSDERMNALIAVVDDLVRHHRREQP
ncbi:MAG: hypothetical protein HY822_15920 [Acidobacteria bacterium]|nr:hypothetical protein [Acidobacteriota bacterium]